MKKLLIASLSLAFLGNATVGSCGMDFSRSHEVGVPPTFCWARQDLGEHLFNGLLNRQCSGEACPLPNTTLNFLQ